MTILLQYFYDRVMIISIHIFDGHVLAIITIFLHYHLSFNKNITPALGPKEEALPHFQFDPTYSVHL